MNFTLKCFVDFLPSIKTDHRTISFITKDNPRQAVELSRQTDPFLNREECCQFLRNT